MISATFGGHRFTMPEPNQASFPVPASTQISIGDLMYWDSGSSVAKPLSAYTVGTAQALDQEAMARLFLGAARTARSTAQTAAGVGDIVNGVLYEFDCAAATFEPDDWLGVVRNGGGTALEDQSAVKVLSPRLAIAQVVKRYASNTTKVLARLLGRPAPFKPQMLGPLAAQGREILTASDADTTLTVDQVFRYFSVEMTPTAARKIIPPAAASCAGAILLINNLAAMTHAINFRSPADDATILAVAAAKQALVWSNGTAWRALAGA